MINPETHTCWTCGFTWKHGKHGGHSCSLRLKARIAELESQLAECHEALLIKDTALCNLIDERDRLRYENKAYWDERQQLRDILSVPIITGEGTCAAEFDARYTLVDSAKILRATIGRLCSTGITCCESNTSEWMDHWANAMNSALATIGERDRVKRESIGFGIVDSQISIDDARKI